VVERAFLDEDSYDLLSFKNAGYYIFYNERLLTAARMFAKHICMPYKCEYCYAAHVKNNRVTRENDISRYQKKYRR